MKKMKYHILGLLILTMVFCMQIYANADTIEGKCGKSCTYSYDTDTKEIVISGTGEITDNPWMFESYAKDIKTVTIEDGITALNVRYAFGFRSTSPWVNSHGACESLEEVVMAKSVKLIASRAFLLCRKLKTVSIPGVETINRSAFAGCDLSGNVEISKNIKKIGNSAFAGTNIGAGQELVIKKDIIYGYGAFARTAYKKIRYEEGIKNIKCIARSCKYLESVILPNSATRIGEMAFGSCPKLKKITIPIKVKVIGYQAFESSTNLRKVIIKSRKVREINDFIFYNAKNVKVYVPKNKYDEYSELLKKTGAKQISIKKLSK